MKTRRLVSIRWAAAASTGSMLLAVVWPREALAAASDGKRKRAAELFESGKALFQAGAFAEACPKLEDSYRLDPSTGTLLALASCHERQGRLELAWEELTRARAIVQREGRKDRIEYVESLLAELAPRVPASARATAAPRPRATSSPRAAAAASTAAAPAASAAPAATAARAPAAEPIDQGATPDAVTRRSGPSQPHTHDGFFLQAGLGAAYLKAVDEEGAGISGSLLLGATPWPGMVLGAGALLTGQMGMGGPFLAFYPDPRGGLSVQGLLGYAMANSELGTGSGMGAGGSVSYEWWAAPQASAGIAGRLLVSSVSDDYAGSFTSYAALLTFTLAYH